MKQLSEYILDTAENSLKANASTVHIVLREHDEASLVEMSVRDDGDGMSEDVLLRVGKERFTTGGGSGVGLMALKDLSARGGGNFSIESKLGAGTSVYASFRRDILADCPIGDIAATLIALIAGAPNVRILFRHEKNGITLADFDTDTVKETLGGDISPNEPRVLLCIREYITELYGRNYSELFQKG